MLMQIWIWNRYNQLERMDMGLDKENLKSMVTGKYLLGNFVSFKEMNFGRTLVI